MSLSGLYKQMWNFSCATWIWIYDTIKCLIQQYKISVQIGRKFYSEFKTIDWKQKSEQFSQGSYPRLLMPYYGVHIAFLHDVLTCHRQSVDTLLCQQMYYTKHFYGIGLGHCLILFAVYKCLKILSSFYRFWANAIKGDKSHRKDVR